MHINRTRDSMIEKNQNENEEPVLSKITGVFTAKGPE